MKSSGFDSKEFSKAIEVKDDEVEEMDDNDKEGESEEYEDISENDGTEDGEGSNDGNQIVESNLKRKNGMVCFMEERAQRALATLARTTFADFMFRMILCRLSNQHPNGTQFNL